MQMAISATVAQVMNYFVATAAIAMPLAIVTAVVSAAFFAFLCRQI